MITIYADVLVSNKLLELLSERGRNRIIKETLRHGIKFWHDRILPKHFTLSGQQMYPGTFERSKVKVKSGKPAMVDRGDFRERMLSNPKIRATFKSASIKYTFGRPSFSRSMGDLNTFRGTFNDDLRKTNPRNMTSQSRNRIFGFMRGKKIKFEDARKQILASSEKKIFKRTGYNKETKKQMVRGIVAMNAKDRQSINDFMTAFVRENMEMGVANYSIKKKGINIPGGFF